MSAKKCDNMVSIPSNDMIVITYGCMFVLLSYKMMIILFDDIFFRIVIDDGVAKTMKRI